MSCPARICCKARTPFPLSVVSYTSMLGKLSGLQISGRSFVRMDRLSCVVSFVRMDRLSCVVPCSCCSLYAATYLINVSLFVLNTSSWCVPGLWLGPGLYWLGPGPGPGPWLGPWLGQRMDQDLARPARWNACIVIDLLCFKTDQEIDGVACCWLICLLHESVLFFFFSSGVGTPGPRVHEQKSRSSLINRSMGWDKIDILL